MTRLPGSGTKKEAQKNHVCCNGSVVKFTLGIERRFNASMKTFTELARLHTLYRIQISLYIDSKGT